MKFSNLHQHSTFSDGKHTPEEIVLKAIENGMESIGFSDHFMTPYEMKVGYNGITKNKCDDYLKEIDRLKKIYANKINVFKGIEADLYSVLNTKLYDYVIGSVHYLEHDSKTYPIDHTAKQQLDYVNEACGGNKLLFARNYFNAVSECIEKFKPDIIGHFDLITKFSLINEDDCEYKKIANETLRNCLKITNVLEINTGAISRGYRKTPYPATFLLERALEENANIILSADSHNKNTVTYFFEESINILKEIGFKHIVKFTNKGFIKETI